MSKCTICSHHAEERGTDYTIEVNGQLVCPSCRIEQLEAIVDRYESYDETRWNELHRDWAEAMQRAAELQAIVDKLPKTADNVTVVPGMTLWDANGDSYVVEWVALESATDGPAAAYDARWNHSLDLRKCFSAPEAAEATRSESTSV